MFNYILAVINDALYGWLLVVLLLGSGIYFSFRTGFPQLRLIRLQLRAATERSSDGVSSFQALMVSTASRVGTGNIVGVSTALCLGGPGAVFWMWIVGLLGGATSFIECTLAQLYKKQNADGCFGGPTYYIEACYRQRWPAVVFSVLLILSYGIGFNMLASYNLQSSFSTYSFYALNFSPALIGAVTAGTVLLCLSGGGKRILKITGFVVPVMGLLYIGVASGIVLWNIDRLPLLIVQICKEAFDFKALAGGLSGSALMLGIRRGLFSNEAGVGSAPNAAASATVTHPAKQGLVQILSVFIDTILICSATAFMCLCSGVAPDAALSGAPYIQAAARNTLGVAGPFFITTAMVLFGFTTILGNYYYVDKGFQYIWGSAPGLRAQRLIRLCSGAVVFLGAVAQADLLWNLADLGMGLMALINIPVLLRLGHQAVSALRDYTRKVRLGSPDRFCGADVSMDGKLEYWDSDPPPQK